ncbi:tyrosine-type recombinase/integrase [Thermoleptolyngbya sp. M55_K2018_002]|uniref:tyrosine-type recombinase/integrase n=1 Tax=Thermoleptolyngbya sp. M55_K2018_002 TaxID=2747808 RepID=UPI0025E6257B|nr:tyrosine-type recombinase/integrase [Thermoleptolyngbya sp. M55_K2018_002]
MGSVRVESCRGRLRLRWRVDGQRYCFYLGLDDTPTNAANAKLKANEIERDIAQDIFDPTLERYRGGKASKSLEVHELFRRYLEHKRDEVYSQTLTKYSGLLTHLKAYFGGKTIGQLSPADCQKFKRYLENKLVPRTVQERLWMLESCWDWAIAQRKVATNPWKGMASKVKPGPAPRPNPFTLDEVRRIVEAFRQHRSYRHYADFVEFLLGTGCRTGEAIALVWGDVTEDCSQIWFGKTRSVSKIQELKAGQAGFVPLSRHLRELLQRRRPVEVDPEALIFPAPRGGYLDKHNFRRVWENRLAIAGVPYRKPYTSRHTLITYWLQQGEDPLTVAKFCRTSPRMIYRSYAGYIPSKTTLPALLDSAFASLDLADPGN